MRYLGRPSPLSRTPVGNARCEWLDRLSWRSKRGPEMRGKPSRGPVVGFSQAREHLVEEAI
jgi:hypothetical protein